MGSNLALGKCEIIETCSDVTLDIEVGQKNLNLSDFNNVTEIQKAEKML